MRDLGAHVRPRVDVRIEAPVTVQAAPAPDVRVDVHTPAATRRVYHRDADGLITAHVDTPETKKDN